MADVVLDCKKEYKDLHLPKNQATVIEFPQINFVAVEGKGDPNNPPDENSAAIELHTSEEPENPSVVPE
jgi:hypothetical protein